jgi:hypothetical protein
MDATPQYPSSAEPRSAPRHRQRFVNYRYLTPFPDSDTFPGFVVDRSVDPTAFPLAYPGFEFSPSPLYSGERGDRGVRGVSE